MPVCSHGIIYAHARTRNIYELCNLHRTLPLTMAVFVTGALAVIGVPPLCGFFSKWYLVLGAIQAQQWFFVFVILMSSLLNTVLFFVSLSRYASRPSKLSRPGTHTMILRFGSIRCRWGN